MSGQRSQLDEFTPKAVRFAAWMVPLYRSAAHFETKHNHHVSFFLDVFEVRMMMKDYESILGSEICVSEQHS